MKDFNENTATFFMVVFVCLFNLLVFGLKLGIVFYFAKLLLTNIF